MEKHFSSYVFLLVFLSPLLTFIQIDQKFFISSPSITFLEICPMFFYFVAVINFSKNRFNVFLLLLLYQFRIYAKTVPSFTNFAFMRIPHVYMHQLQWRYFITCMVENRQPEWSVTWTQCYLAFLICAMCYFRGYFRGSP